MENYSLNNYVYPSDREVLVESSNIDSVAYNNYDSTLFINFKRGGRYVYLGVPDSVYTALLGSQSKGSFFHQYIKNKYSYKKL